MRHVPRGDRGDHTDRFAAYEDRAAGALALFLLLDPAGGSDGDTEGTDGGQGLASHREQHGRAVLQGDQLGELLVAGGEGVLDAGDDLDALLERQPRPRAVVERLTCRGDREVHVLGRRVGHAADHALGHGRDHLDGVAAGRLGPAAADEERAVFHDGMAVGHVLGPRFVAHAGVTRLDR